MVDFIQIFGGVPLIIISPEYFKNDTIMKEVELWSSIIYVDIKEANKLCDKQPMFPVRYTEPLWYSPNERKKYDSSEISMQGSYRIIDIYKKFKQEYDME